MLGEFMYHNPTTLYFGSQSLENLDRELPLLKCTLFTGHPVRRVHFALYD
ncbi:iron-containing alcohol dehydrogenase [Acidaminococcus intestini]|nr:iron-containing alcohol dehydrogenase [Acidaminococcus intestini]